jgi:hypothetical protein
VRKNIIVPGLFIFSFLWILSRMTPAPPIISAMNYSERKPSPSLPFHGKEGEEKVGTNGMVPGEE